MSVKAKNRQRDDSFPCSAPAHARTGYSLHRKVLSGRTQRWVLIGTLALNDALMISFALMAAWYIRVESGLISYYSSGPFSAYLEIVIIALPLLLCTFFFNGLYDFRLLLGGVQEYKAVFGACSYGMIVLVFVSFMRRDFLPSRGWLLISWILCILLIGGTRFFWRRLFRWVRGRYGWLITRTLIVGANEHGRAITRQLTCGKTGIEVVGFVDDFLPPGTEVMDGKTVLGVSPQLEELATTHGAEQVIVIQNAVAWETFREILQQAAVPNGFELHLSPGFYEILTTGVQVANNSFVPLLRVEKVRITGMDLVMKTALDFGLGTVLFVVTLPLMLAGAVAIGLRTGYPLFDRYEVLGLGGRPFRTIKFHTGYQGISCRRLTGTPDELAPEPSAGHCIGSLLYRTGLDKLPQLLDVLRGRMSLVGPRCMAPGPNKLRQSDLSNLFTLKPGWTGLWAVGGAQSLEDEMRLNIHYVRNWTIWLDFQILLQTAKLVVKRRSRLAETELNRDGRV